MYLHSTAKLKRKTNRHAVYPFRIVCLYLAIIANGHAFSIVFPVHRNEYCTLFFVFIYLFLPLSLSLCLFHSITMMSLLDSTNLLNAVALHLERTESIAAKWRQMHWTKIEVDNSSESRYCTRCRYIGNVCKITVYIGIVEYNCAFHIDVISFVWRCAPPPSPRTRHFYLFAISILLIFSFSPIFRIPFWAYVHTAYCLQFSCHIIAKQLT